MKSVARLTLTFDDAASAEAVAAAVALDDEGYIRTARRRERRAQTPGAGRLEGEEAVLGAEGEDMCSVREDVADLPVVLRYDVGYGPPQDDVRGAEAELEFGRRADPQRVPVGDPAARGTLSELVERGRPLPK